MTRIHAIAVPSNGKHDAAYLKAIGGGYPVENRVDQWSFYQGECTSYAAFRLNADGIPFDNKYGGQRWGSASNWLATAKKLSSLVQVVTEPAKGDIAWSDIGHVAYVEGTNSKSEVSISEYNYSKLCYTNRTLPKSGFKFLRFTRASTFLLFSELSSKSQSPGATFDFGRVRTYKDAELEFTIENKGTSRESLTVTVEGTGFSLESKPSSSLSGGRDTDFEIEFRPKKKSDHSGKLTIWFGGRSYVYNLVGKGV